MYIMSRYAIKTIKLECLAHISEQENESGFKKIPYSQFDK